MKPRTIHMVPVFALTDEPGWIILTGKKKAKIARLFAGLDKEKSSWEAPVKSWFVHHEKIGDAIGMLESAAKPATIAFCQECSNGKACSAWEGISDGGFLFREQNDVAPPDRTTTVPENPEDVPIEPEPSFWTEFLRVFFGPASRFRPQQQNQPMPQGMPPEQAAQALGIPWPCTWEQLTVAFRVAAMKAHPDHGGSTEEMAKINLAREVLTQHLAKNGATK